MTEAENTLRKNFGAQALRKALEQHEATCKRLRELIVDIEAAHAKPGDADSLPASTLETEEK